MNTQNRDQGSFKTLIRNLRKIDEARKLCTSKGLSESLLKTMFIEFDRQSSSKDIAQRLGIHKETASRYLYTIAMLTESQYDQLRWLCFANPSINKCI